MLKHDYQRRATAQALARFTPSGLSLTNLPTRWGRTLEPAKLAPAQLPASRQNRSTNGSSQRGRVERANYAFPRSIGSMRAVLANRAQKITLSALPNWDAVSVQMPTSTILNQRALIGYDIFEALDARSGVHKSAPPTGANGAEIGGLSIAKGAQNIMVIDTTAESTDTWEVLLIRTILVSMDIALFLLETMIVATIPVIRDGGGHLLARISDTFYLEERLEDASQAVATALSDWKEVAGILNYSGGANSSTAEATNEVRPQRWQEYPHFTHTK